MEKERFGMPPGAEWSPKVLGRLGNGEEATPVICAMASSSPLRLVLSSISKLATRTTSLAGTSTGMYRRSGYTRLMGFGMPVELRLRPELPS